MYNTVVKVIHMYIHTVEMFYVLLVIQSVLSKCVLFLGRNFLALMA